MSRCFPYPPPGYTPSRGTNEALIESIKLQKEEVEKAKLEKALADQAKAERKREKKEKKERKREKKEKKKKSKEEEKAKQNKTIQLDHPNVKSLEHVNGGIPQKQIKDDTEPLEKSNITEEHGEPTQQAPSYSSDSTQSGKRKRPASEQVPNATRPQGGGNILRIRLPSQKNMKHEISRGNVEQQQPIHKPSENLMKQDVSAPRPHESQNQVTFETRGRDEQPCSTSGRKNVQAEQGISLRRADDDKTRSTRLAAEPLRADQKLKFIAPTPVTQPAAEPLKADQKMAPTPVTRHNDASHVDYIYSGSSSEFRKKRKVADKYRELIENWNPPSMMFMDTEEDDWLAAASKKVVNRPEKVVVASTDMSCSSSSLWPQARFLPEANIYALPYAIPF